jgi:hypothetical protein
MSARTLEDAYNALDPRQPVKPEQVDELFVLRPHSPVDLMGAQLQLSHRPQKMLFVGHRGAGKSSEMAYLSRQLEESHLSILMPLYDVYQSRDITHTEIIFALTLQLLARATDEAVVPKGLVTENWERLLEAIYQPLREQLFGADPIPADSEQSITLKLRVLVADLEAKISTQSYTRNQVRDKFEGRLAELLEQVRRLSQLLEHKLDKKLLLIIEDLDKFDVGVVRDLFLDHAQTLISPYPNIIYSFPVGMRYENAFKQIEQSFDMVHILPNVALQQRDGGVDEEGRGTLWQILQRRVHPDLFAGGVLDAAIDWSGGHVKTLIQLTQQSILQAVVARTETIQPEHLQQAQQRLRDDYMVLLRREQLALLRTLRDDADKDLVDVTPEKQELLFNGSLLEYGNTVGPWADVNPIVAELLEQA